MTSEQQQQERETSDVFDAYAGPMQKYIQQHSLPRPVAVWVSSKTGDEISVEQVRELTRHFDADDTFDGTKFVILPVSPHREADLLVEKAEDAGFRADVDDGYYDNWPPQGAVPQDHLLYELAEIATREWISLRLFGDARHEHALNACDVLFSHLGWIGNSTLRAIIEVSCDTISVPEGDFPNPASLMDVVRKTIAPLVHETGIARKMDDEDGSS